MKKYTRKIDIIISIIIFLLLLTGCSAIPVTKQTPPYNALTVEQIKNFIKEKEVTLREYITLIEIKATRNFTVILFETDTLWGSYALTSGENGHVSVCCGGVSNNKDQPVSIVSFGCSGQEGSINYTEIKLNDNVLIEQAYSIKTIFDNRTETVEYLHGNIGCLFLHQDSSQVLSRIVIYNKNKVLYDDTVPFFSKSISKKHLSAEETIAYFFDCYSKKDLSGMRKVIYNRFVELNDSMFADIESIELITCIEEKDLSKIHFGGSWYDGTPYAYTLVHGKYDIKLKEGSDGPRENGENYCDYYLVKETIYSDWVIVMWGLG